MANEKIKLLRILEILQETDFDTTLTAPDICRKLKLYDIDAERKSVCRDVNVLMEAGYPIRLSTDKRKGYYMEKHLLDDWEIKVLTDAVWQSKFITTQDSQRLVDKLLGFSSTCGQKRLKRQIVPVAKRKTDNGDIKNYIEGIMQAIYAGKKVKFQYIKHDKNLVKQLRKDGYFYTVNPYAVIWQNETYYLICNHDKYDNLAHYRLDRIENLVVCQEEKIRNIKEIMPLNPSMQIQEYVNTAINHFSGELIYLVLECKEAYMEILYDEFGNAMYTEQVDGENVRVRVEVQKSEGLMIWLMQYADICKVIKPVSLKEELVERLNKIVKWYKENDRKKEPDGRF